MNMAMTNAQLQEQLTAAQAALTKAERRAEKVTGELNSERERANANAQARQEAEAELAKTREELTATHASLKAYKGSATKAQKAATVLKKQLSPEARRIGAMKPPRDAAQEEARREDLEAAFANDTTELVYSDGQREIRELAPLIINGDAWRVTPQGRVLVHEPELEPGDCSRQEVVLRGFALLNEAGDQVGWCPHDPVSIGRNQRVKLAANSIRF